MAPWDLVAWSVRKLSFQYRSVQFLKSNCEVYAKESDHSVNNFPKTTVLIIASLYSRDMHSPIPIKGQLIQRPPLLGSQQSKSQ